MTGCACRDRPVRGVRPDAHRAVLGAIGRNMIRLRRNNASIVSAFVIPGLFVLVFWAVFGHAADQAGMDFATFLLPAGMFQAAMFSAGGSAMAIGVDQESGLLTRMRSLPIPAPVAVLGRLGCDLLRAVASLVTVTGVALACGASPAAPARMALAFVVGLGVSVILGVCYDGITLRSRHPVQSVEMPLLMLSTAFVPVETLPDWLEPVIKHMPFPPIIDTMRALVDGSCLGATGWEALAWLGGGGLLGGIWVIRSFGGQP